MNDVIFLVIDSLMADKVFAKNGSVSITPFLDKIRSESIVATNLYSQGPFTEAGTKGLLTATDTLDDEGYYLRYDKSKLFLTGIFHDLGYESYSLIYPTCLYSKWILDKLDGIYYTSGLMFDVFWSQKLAHYAELRKLDELDDRDIQDCIELIDIIFVAWLHSVDPENSQYRILLRPYDTEYDYKKCFDRLSIEKEKFEIDKKSYILDLLDRGLDHPLNNIPSDFIPNFIRNESITKAFSKHKEFQKKLFKKQYWNNLKNNRIPYQAFFELPSRIKNGLDIYTFGEFGYLHKTINRGKDLKTCQIGHRYKLLLSAHTQFEQVCKLITEKHEKPRFVTAHVEEPHYFTTYFSYDTDDIDLINSELDYAEEYVNSIDSKYKGLISYDLAVRYIDREIERLFQKLENCGRLQNTTVVITADHGSSYNCYPLRKRIVNNCHTENFHIPLLIYQKGLQGKSVESLCTSKDIIPTVLDFLGKKIPSSATGQSILNDLHPYKAVSTEYMGPGCPDMRRNKACITIRNENYLLSFEGKLNEEFNEKNILEIYDLKNDPLELNNINKERNHEVLFLISQLRKRFYAIKNNNKAWLSCNLKK